MNTGMLIAKYEHMNPHSSPYHQLSFVRPVFFQYLTIIMAIKLATMVNKLIFARSIRSWALACQGYFAIRIIGFKILKLVSQTHIELVHENWVMGSRVNMPICWTINFG